MTIGKKRSKHQATRSVEIRDKRTRVLLKRAAEEECVEADGSSDKPVGMATYSEGITISRQWNSVRMDAGVTMPARMAPGSKKDALAALEAAEEIVAKKMAANHKDLRRMLRELGE